MKKETHPVYFAEAKVTCVCGATYQIGSTLEKINVEICRACHPFFTGHTKMIDTAGRVEKFEKRRAKSASAKK